MMNQHDIFLSFESVQDIDPPCLANSVEITITIAYLEWIYSVRHATTQNKSYGANYLDDVIG